MNSCPAEQQKEISSAVAHFNPFCGCEMQYVDLGRAKLGGLFPMMYVMIPYTLWGGD